MGAMPTEGHRDFALLHTIGTTMTMTGRKKGGMPHVMEHLWGSSCLISENAEGTKALIYYALRGISGR